MPCSDYGRSEQETAQRVQQLEEWLCSALRMLEGQSSSLLQTLPVDLRVWWEEHCGRDLRGAILSMRRLLETQNLSREQAADLERLIELAQRAK